ncbi:hypothetical protein IFM89_009524 [Coptis chinensis]|uniref:PWWP domain-containing protein n=1 Tax=Coptis chinensis TaxID=261450 RepID=A0A835HUV2_9MAGN|nr:hypothetical protein IFM89_009524 [Coptis chinensis]
METLSDKSRVSSSNQGLDSPSINVPFQNSSGPLSLVETQVKVVEKMDRNGIGNVSVDHTRKKRGRKKISVESFKDAKGINEGDVLIKSLKVVGENVRSIRRSARKVRDKGSTSNGLNNEVQESQNIDEESKEVDEDGDDEEEEETGDLEHGFSMGDLVWVKIKSHPWWPGQIYNPLDASATAEKYKRRNSLLVVCFGDGTFAWCYPYQLKPFRENFKQFANQGSSKNFLRAVKEAVNEIGRLVVFEMACSCLASEQITLMPVATNAGIKEGVAVPYAGIEGLSVTEFEPAEFIEDLKSIAQGVSMDNMLELVVLKRRLSAFYCAKGYGQLPRYHEPTGILDLNDSAGNGIRREDNVEGGKADLSGSPVEADWLSLPVDSGVGKTGITISRRFHGITEAELFQTKKQRSIAELLAGESNVKHDEACIGGLTEEVSKSGKETVRPRKRKKNMGSEVEHNNYAAEELIDSDKQTSASRTRKRDFDTEDGIVNNEAEEDTISVETTPSTRNGRIKKGSEFGNNGDVAEETTLSGKQMPSRTRKRSKRSEVGNVNDVAKEAPISSKQTIGPMTRNTFQDPKVGDANHVVQELTFSGEPISESREKRTHKGKDVGDEKNVAEELSPAAKQTTESRIVENSLQSDLGNGSDIVTEGAGGSKQTSLSQMPNKTKLSGALSAAGENKASNVENDVLGIGTGIKSGSSLRERKKSKYLSPPYTNLGQRHRNLVSTNETEKESPSISHVEESLVRTADQFTVSHTITRCNVEPSQKELSKDSHSVGNPSGSSSPLKLKEFPTKPVLEEGNTSAHEMLSDFRSAALDPLYLTENQSDDSIKGFFTKMRSSVYRDGSDFKIYNKYLAGGGSRKRISLDTEADLPGKDTYETGHPKSEGNTERKKRKKKGDETLRSPKMNSKHAGGTSDMQMSPNVEDNGVQSVVALLLTFAEGVSLPSKEGLITTFSTFGDIRESETKVIEDSGCAQVVFARSSDAEEAYNNFGKIRNSFGSAVVSYRLRYLSVVSRASETVGNSHQQDDHLPSSMEGGNTQRNQSALGSQVGEVPPLELVRGNLQMTTSVLEKSWANLSLEVKANLDGEIKDLLNKETVVVRVIGRIVFHCEMVCLGKGVEAHRLLCIVDYQCVEGVEYFFLGHRICAKDFGTSRVSPGTGLDNMMESATLY